MAVGVDGDRLLLLFTSNRMGAVKWGSGKERKGQKCAYWSVRGGKFAMFNKTGRSVLGTTSGGGWSSNARRVVDSPRPGT